MHFGCRNVKLGHAILESRLLPAQDSLERFYDVHQIEANQADEAAWEALPARWLSVGCFL